MALLQPHLHEQRWQRRFSLLRRRLLAFAGV